MTEIENKNLMMFQAARHGDIETVLGLLSDSSNPAKIDEEDYRVMKIAAYHGHTELFKTLHTSSELSKKANIIVENEYALYYSSINNHTELIKYLLETPEYQELLSIEVRPYIVLNAIKENNIDLLKYCLEQSNLPFNIDRLKTEAYTHAARYGCLEVIRYLLETKKLEIDVHANNNQALFNAVEKGYIPVIHYLLHDAPQCIDIHVNNDEAFKIAAFAQNDDVLDYFFNVENITITPAIQQFLDTKGTPILKVMIEYRDLNKKLKVNTIQKRTKI